MFVICLFKLLPYLRYPPYTEQWKQEVMFKLCYYKPST